MVLDIGLLEQQVLLAIMRLHPTAYGISIKEQIKERTGRDYSFGAIYASLDRLEEKGFVISRQGEPTAPRGGRRKLYFTLTASGQAALEETLRAIDSLRKGVRWRALTARLSLKLQLPDH
jgi:DNA-binding PadR family transcriptional regulator